MSHRPWGSPIGAASLGNMTCSPFIRRLVPLLLFVPGCGGGATEEGPPLRILIVDEAGEPTVARRVLYQPQPADAFWITPSEATCETGEPPCSTWVITTPITERIAVAADRTTEATPTEECQPYASTFAIVHPATREVPSQELHLTLPTYGTYCISGDTGRAIVNVEHDEAVDETDTLALPDPATGPITVSLVDQDGDPVPGTSASWYYHPEGEEYDGEHPLRCADVRCETWVLDGDDVPRAGTVFFSASYAGPLNPFLLQGWVGYDGAPFELAAGDQSGLAPRTITLTLSTVDEGATGG